MKELKNKHIIFLSLGSYATNKNLIYSQMLKLADSVNKKLLFKSVQSIVIIPRMLVLKNYKKHLIDKANLCNMVSSKLVLLYSWLKNGAIYSFLFKNIFYKFLKAQVYKLIKDLDGEVIFHCRSYYATDFALYLKNCYPQHKIKVLFDMRSLLPPEFVYTSKVFGKLFYVKGKEWERKLLKKSDLSLMVAKNAINLLYLEDGTYKNICYIPIIGFSKKIKTNNIKKEFDRRWRNKSFGYVGSLGLWHNVESIEKIAKLLKNNFKYDHKFIIATNNMDIKSNIEKITIPNEGMPDFYKKQLAVVIPGLLTDMDYFESLKMTSNFFSTKASEALSLGVPLIVNKQISELAKLVLDYKCGLVFEYNLKSDKISFINASEKDINSKVFWMKITKNAFVISEQFCEETVEQMYLNFWKKI